MRRPRRREDPGGNGRREEARAAGTPRAVLRIWATRVLREHLVRGYTVNAKRLKELRQAASGISLGTRRCGANAVETGSFLSYKRDSPRCGVADAGPSRRIGMVPVVGDKVPELVALCSRRGVKSLSLFGSAARGDFDPRRSDVDLLVEFEPMTPAQHADAYFGLLEDAEALFGLPVDLVELQALRNPYIRERVEATREVVYGA